MSRADRGAPWWRRLAVLAAVAATLTGALLVSETGVALACSCALVPQQLADQVPDYDAVFVGRVVESLDADGTAREFRGPPAAFTFEVSAVHRGEVAQVQQIGTAESLGACGYEFLPGEDYAVFAVTAGRMGPLTPHVPDDGLVASICSPTAPVDEVAVETLPPASDPMPGEDRFLGQATLLDRIVPDDGDGQLVRWTLVALAAAALGGGAWLLARRDRARS